MTSIHAISSVDHECVPNSLCPNSFCQLQIYTFLMPLLEINLTWVWLGPIALRKWFFDMVSNVGARWAKSICSSTTTHTSWLVRIGLENVLCVIVALCTSWWPCSMQALGGINLIIGPCHVSWILGLIERFAKVVKLKVSEGVGGMEDHTSEKCSGSLSAGAPSLAGAAQDWCSGTFMHCLPFYLDKLVVDCKKWAQPGSVS